MKQYPKKLWRFTSNGKIFMCDRDCWAYTWSYVLDWAFASGEYLVHNAHMLMKYSYRFLSTVQLGETTRHNIGRHSSRGTMS